MATSCIMIVAKIFTPPTVLSSSMTRNNYTNMSRDHDRFFSLQTDTQKIVSIMSRGYCKILAFLPQYLRILSGLSSTTTHNSYTNMLRDHGIIFSLQMDTQKTISSTSRGCHKILAFLT